MTHQTQHQLTRLIFSTKYRANICFLTFLLLLFGFSFQSSLKSLTIINEALTDLGETTGLLIGVETINSKIFFTLTLIILRNEFHNTNLINPLIKELCHVIELKPFWKTKVSRILPLCLVTHLINCNGQMRIIWGWKTCSMV